MTQKKNISIELSDQEKYDVEDVLHEQALQLENMLPVLMRNMFTLVPDHPAADVPVAQLRTCTILQTGPRTMTSLSEELGISLSAMTQIADRMERAGLVERVMMREDRRQRLLQLSELGSEMMRTRKRIRIQQAAEALALISDGQRTEMLQLLQILLKAVTSLTSSSKSTDPGVKQEPSANRS